VLAFFVITSIVNLALGYGLAIYLGHPRVDLPAAALPEQLSIDGGNCPPLSAPITSDVAAATPPAPSPAEVVPPSLPGISAPLLPEPVSPMRQSGAPSTPTSAEKKQAELPPAKDSVVNEQPASSEQLDNRFEPPELPGGTPSKTGQTVSDGSATKMDVEAEKPIGDDRNQDSSEALPRSDNGPSSMDAKVNTASQPPSEEDLLAGIAAFRAQLSEVNPGLKTEDEDSVGDHASPT